MNFWNDRAARAEGALILLDRMRGRTLVQLDPTYGGVFRGCFEWKEFPGEFVVDEGQPVCDETEIEALRGVRTEPKKPEVFVLGAVDGEAVWMTLDTFIDSFMDGGEVGAGWSL